MHYDLFLRPAENGFEAVCRAVLGSIVHEAASAAVPADAETVRLSVTGSPMYYAFSAAWNGEAQTLGRFETRFLATEVAGNFTGIVLGLFAENTNKTEVWSDFTDFSLDYSLPDDEKAH